MQRLIYFYLFLFSLTCSFIVVKLFKNIAIKFGFVDRPDQDRKIHNKAIPLLGGIGMYIAFTSTILFHITLIIFKSPILLLLSNDILLKIQGIRSLDLQLTTIFTTTFIIVLLGLFDDLKPLKASIKLLVQISVAILVFLSGIRVSFFINNDFASLLLTVLWIVGITNAFNLMDNMDGLSCGTALIATSFFCIIAITSGQFFVASILLCFAGVLLGFLIFNFPPAKIFMGDAGSMFIGYLLSIFSITNTYYKTDAAITQLSVLMPIIILAIPIFDTFSVIFIRLKNKKSIFKADKNHISHRLLNLGMSQKQAVLFIYLASFCIGIGALLLGSLSKTGCFLVLIQTITIITLIVFLEKFKKCKS